MRTLDRICAVLVALGWLALAAGVNAAPIIVGTYYEDNTSANCASYFICDATFSRIPKGSSVLITHVTCHVETGTDYLSLAKLGLKTKAGSIDSAREEIIARSPVSTLGGNNYYQVGGETSFLYEQRQFPYFRIHMGILGPMYLKCRITGLRPSPL